MHGVKRPRPGQREPEEVERAKAAREQARIDEYLKLRAQLAHYKRDATYSEEALQLTTRILTTNPEYSSGWAHRRRILLRGIMKDRPEQETQDILEGDLALTAKCLLRNPKEYAIWEHRKWLLKVMPDPDWHYEMKMVESYLERDARNFHGWDYRRYVVASIRAAPDPPAYSTRKRPAPTTTSELAYTTNKISASFSNYSAWHYRSKLLTRLWQDEGLGSEDPERLRQLDEEYDLVKSALYTDPDDQSAWIYHRWLTRSAGSSVLRREIAAIEELLELEPTSKWCLESLIHYSQALLDTELAEAEAHELKKKCTARLELLQDIDGLRANRYRDLLQSFQ